jgi:hypothetical protein
VTDIETSSFIAAAERRQQEQEDVEDGEEDRGGQQGSGPDVRCAPQSLEVEHHQSGEDHQAGYRVDQRPVRDLDEDRHDAEQDQPEQRLEQDAGKAREVPTGGVSRGAEPRDEQGRRPAGLLHSLRIGGHVVRERRRHSEADEDAEAEQQRRRHLLGPLHRTFRATRQTIEAMKNSQPHW